jgi:signal transduction histidine kinase
MQSVKRAAYTQSLLFRYGLGVVVTITFLLGARVIYAMISYNPLIMVLTAIIVVSWSFGRGPGIICALISAFGIRPLFLPNAPYHFDLGDVGRLLFYLLLTGFVSYLVGARRKAEAALLAANADLDRRVQERTRELHASNEDLRRSNEALRRANADLEQFAYSASHDLQEPLRNVAIYSQIIGKRYSKTIDDQGREYLKIVTDGARRMEMLVFDLLAYTQAGRDEQEALDEIDANVSLVNTLHNLSQAIIDAQAEVTSGVLPRLRMRKVHLEQIFQNLIGNAIKYRRPEVSPHIRISAETSGDHWRFSIEDNGIGINPEYRERIFGIFKRLHTNGQYSGTGIGLAICQRLVERYDGRIWVESQPGKGATFFFTIKNNRG